MKTVVKYSFCTLLFALCTFLTACQNVKYAEPANANLSSVQNLTLTTDVRNLTFTWDEAAGVDEVMVYRNGKLQETILAGVKSFFVFRETPNEDILYTFKVKSGDLVSEGITQTVHIDYDGNAGVTFLALSNATAQEKMARAWFEANYVANGKGQVVDAATVKGITQDGKSTINPDRYSTIWLPIEGRAELPAELDAEAIEGIRTLVAGEGKLYLTGDAYQLLVPMKRMAEEKMPTAVDNSTIEGNGDWGLNCFMHKKLDYREHAFFAGLVDANGKLMLQNSANRSTANHLWNIGGASAMNSWNNEMYGYMYATISSDASAQYGGLAYLEKFGCSDGVILKGVIVANLLPAYQWVEGNAYQSNIEKLTSNILEEIRIVK